jgi:hypothetical protein
VQPGEITAEKEGVRAITKIVFFGIGKIAISEKSRNGCEHCVKAASDAPKPEKTKMLSSVPCVTGLAGSFGKMGGMIDQNEKLEGQNAKLESGGKARSDSILHGLTAEQQASVKKWLFEENVSFARVAERCRAELGIEVSKTSVIRYYRRALSVRRLEKTLNQRREGRPDVATGDADAYYGELMATAGEMALESARGDVDDAKRRAFVDCTKLLIAARREGNYARRVDLAREKFEFDAATACVMRQMEIQMVLEDESLTDEERIRSVREELFGPDLPA